MIINEKNVIPRWERVLIFLFPSLILESKELRELWYVEHKKKFQNICKGTLPFVALTYLMHFFFVDLQSKEKNHIYYWVISRLGLTVFALFIWIKSFSKNYYKKEKYKLSTLVFIIAASGFQIYSTLFIYSEIPIIFSFLVPVLGVWLLQLSPGKSFFALSALLVPICLLILMVHRNEYAYFNNVVGFYLISTVAMMLLRLSLVYEVNFFVVNQKYNYETKLRIIEKQELLEQIKNFIPKEISHRIFNAYENQRVSIAQAIDGVLRLQVKPIVCLYSDIRGFTVNSKDVKYLKEQVLPNIKMATDIIDKYRGVPRLIGDLILAYFDYSEMSENIKLALKSAKEISESLTVNTVSEVKRYIILSAGIATVGNIGPANGSREVTCLGSPVNLLQRIDELTKNEHFKNVIPPYSIIMTPEVFKLVDSSVVSKSDIKILNFKELNISIRNYSDVLSLYYYVPKSIISSKKAA